MYLYAVDSGIIRILARFAMGANDQGMHEDSAVIDALGGTSAVAIITGSSRSAVSKWRRRGIPDHVELAHYQIVRRARRACERRGQR